MTAMKVDIISRKTIKPSRSTPHLRTFRLSLLDQIMPSIYPTFVFFYPSDANNRDDIIPNFLERSLNLQKSLSETLVHFYPMAGRFKDSASIDCNDEGAYFVEARSSCQLMHFLSQPDLEFVNHFIPTNDTKATELALDYILIVQLTVFDCGGMAIAVCTSHKISDACSMFTFIQSWAASTREPGGEVMCPKFIGGSLLPPRKWLTVPSTTITLPSGKCATRRFVFDASKIASIKAKVCGEIGQRRPTNVEIVVALILRCAITASSSKSGSLRPSLLFLAVNLRTKMVPPLPENTIGNLVSSLKVLVKEAEIELFELVAKIMKELTDFCNEKVNKFVGDEGFLLTFESNKAELLKNAKNLNVYQCTCLCKYPSYGIDFGWGKPIWTTIPLNFRNSIVLVDTKRGDGIEACVTLEEEEMAIFEKNEELLAFASLNPSAFINHCRL